MKPRLTLWMILTAAVAVTGILVWHHHSTSSPVQTEAQNPPALVKSAPVAHVSQPNQPVQPQIMPAAPKLTTANPEAGNQPQTAVQMIVSGQADYRQRTKAIQGLTGKLADDDREALYAFLKQHYSEDARQLGQVLKNQLMDTLSGMQPPLPGLRELLTQIYQDQNQDGVLRDYALQHLAEFYRQMAGASDVDAQTQADELKQTQKVLWSALDNTEGSIAGTALLGLNHLSQEGWPGFDQNKIAEAALNLAGQNGVGELTQITALQVCASLNVKDSLPVVLGAAQQGTTEPVKISAIGALGSLGGPDQVPFLENVLQGRDDRLKPAARQALNQIQQRLQATAKSDNQT